jgi:hypothetical protein
MFILVYCRKPMPLVWQLTGIVLIELWLMLNYCQITVKPVRRIEKVLRLPPYMGGGGRVTATCR